MASRGHRLALAAVAATHGSAVDMVDMVDSGAKCGLLSSRRAASEDSAAVTMVQTVEQRVAVHVSNFRVQVEQLLSDASKEFAHTNKRLAVACKRTAMQLHELPSNFRVRQAAGQAAARLIVQWYKHQFRSDPQLISMLSRLAANVSVGAFDALEVTMKRALQALPAFMQNAYGKQAMNEARYST